MFRLFARMMMVFVLLAIAGAVSGQSAIPAVTITLSAEGLVTIETIPAGWVEITFENTTEAPLFGIMARLDDDVTMEDFMGALMGMMGGDAGMVPPATFIGSPAAMPGTTQSVTYNLAAGSYILLNVAGEEPQIATFVVEGEATDSDFEPEADLRVALVDFAFSLPVELTAGEQTWLIENLGAQWHELIVIPVPDGTTLEDAMMLMMAVEEGAESEGGMPEFAAAWSPMSAGEKAWVQVDLTPGTYLVSCFIPDVNSDEHAIHAALGMIQIVTVTDTLTYTDPDGMFTLDYPAELATIRPDLAAEFGMPFPSVALADSDATIDASVNAELLADGSWGIGVFLIPEFLFAEMGMPEDATLEDRAIAFFAPNPDDNPEGYVLGEVVAFTLDDGTPAVQIAVSGNTEDNLGIFFEVTDGIYAIAPLLTAPGGATDELIEKWWASVNNIEFTGTLEDIMAGMGEQ